MKEQTSKVLADGLKCGLLSVFYKFFTKREKAMSGKLQVEYIDHIAVITINNPPANTWDQESLVRLTGLVEELK